MIAPHRPRRPVPRPDAPSTDRTPTRAVAAALAVGLAATLLPLTAPVAAAAQADGHPVSITSPAPDARVDGPDVTVTGAVGVDASADVAVQFVVDVSGSTSRPGGVRGMDCDGDGTAAGDDLNADGRRGDVLDCEIAAVAALNGSLRARPASAGLVSVGLTGFARTAQVATVDPDPDPGESPSWVKPGDTEGGRDVIPRLTTVAASLTATRIGQYVAWRLADGTDFDHAVRAAVEAFEEPAVAGRRRVVFLLSDGEGTLSDSTLALVREQRVRLRTFAIGAGAGACTTGSALARLAEAGQEACVPVTDPATLTHALSSSLPAGLAGIDVEIDGIHAAASVDSLGRWAATVPGVRDGRRTVVATARYLDGSSSTDRVEVTVGRTFQYVALGDSYASGEGVSPYIGDAFDRESEDFLFLCHRSWTGWPMRLTRTGHAQPIAREAQDDPGTLMDFAACSGARMVNLDTTEQEKNGEKIPLQFRSLTTETDLVTVSIGGNDMGFAPIVTHCMTQLRCYRDGFVDDAAGRSVSLQDWATIRLALMGSELDSIYTQIRERTRPDTEIVALTYPRLVSSSWVAGLFGKTCLVLENDERRWIRGQADVFAEIVHRRAAAHGIAVADVRDAFESHLVCDRDEHLFPVQVPSRPDDLGGWVSAASFHPNEKGVADYAAVVQDALDGVPTRPHAQPFTAADPPTEDSTQAPDIDPLVVTDPEAVLARYAAETVAAVAATVFTEVLIAAPHSTVPTCTDLVTGEHLPVSAHGFAPSTEVTVSVTLDQQEPTVTTATADAAGTLCTQVPAPATAGLLAVEVVGTDEAGGTMLGLTAVEHVVDSDTPDAPGTDTTGTVGDAGATTATDPAPSTVPDAVDTTVPSATTGAQETPGDPGPGTSAVLAAPEAPTLSPIPAAPEEDTAVTTAEPTPRPAGVVLPLTVLALLLVAAALVARPLHARGIEGRRA